MFESLQKKSANAASGSATAVRYMVQVGLLAVVLARSLPAAAMSCENPAVLRFSGVPEQGVARQTDQHQGLIEMLERKIGVRIEMVRPTSYGSVVDGLVNARLDLAILGPASYVSARQRDPGIVPFASHEKIGGAFHEAGNSYRSVLISRSDSRFESLDQLRGAKLALTDPGSTSGALLPRYRFRIEESPRRGVPFDQYFGSIVYAGDHRRAALAVRDGLVDAAYVADDVLSALVDEARLKPDQLRVLWRSAPIPRDPYVYRQALCEPLRKKIREVFLALNAASNPVALAPLGIVRFREVSDDEYRGIYELFPSSGDLKR